MTYPPALRDKLIIERRHFSRNSFRWLRKNEPQLDRFEMSSSNRPVSSVHNPNKDEML